MKKFLLAFLLLLFPLCAGETEIVLWHTFDGPLEAIFLELIENFNYHSGNYKVVPVKHTNYATMFEQGIAAAQDHKQPHILQVYEVATLTAMLTPDLFKPVDELRRFKEN